MTNFRHGQSRKQRYLPSHPLALKTGYVLTHRQVLFDAIGPGWHKCHWCQLDVEWRVVSQHQHGGQNLVVDHVDRNPQNNALENLVPACMPCNTRRGDRTVRSIKDGETARTRVNGKRVRGEERTCRCGATFIVENHIASRDSRERFCSRECSDSALRRTEMVCPSGHELVGDNAYEYGGKISCKTCRAAASARGAAKRKAARAAKRAAAEPKHWLYGNDH